VTYLLDASVLISANNEYYPLDAVPEFWEWLEHQARSNRVKVPHEIADEILNGSSRDRLVTWFKARREILILNEEVDGGLLNEVLENGYGPSLTDAEHSAVGRDPFLIAYGLLDPRSRTVVTRESSAPGKRRQNRKIPDVCRDFGIPCLNPFLMYRQLGFRTNWRAVD
jgi:hypothetical protein